MKPRGMLLFDTPVRIDGRWHRFVTPARTTPLRWWDLWFWLAIVCGQCVRKA